MDSSSDLAASSPTQGLATPSMLRRAGVGRSALSRLTAAGRLGRLVRIRRAVYAAQPLAPLPRFVVTDMGVAAIYVAHVRAVLMSLRRGSAACGRTAAALRGWGLLVEPSRTIEVAVPHGRSRVSMKGVRVRQRRRLAKELFVALPGTRPLWVTTAVRTVVDCCLTLPFVEAVVICDSALRAGDVSIAALLQAVRRQCGVREAVLARRVIRAADPMCGSVLESVLRCRLILAGITGFTTQQVLRDATGKRVLRVDFRFDACRLVVEVDGAKWHLDPVRDRGLDNALACLGYRVLRFTWSDVVHDHARVLAEIESALRAGTKDIQSVARVTAAVA